jgi:hypothetical protein
MKKSGILPLILLKKLSYVLRISKTLFLSQSYVCTNHVSLWYYIFILKNMLNHFLQLAFILYVGNVLDSCTFLYTPRCRAYIYLVLWGLRTYALIGLT